VKDDGSTKAGDFVAIFGEDVGEDGVFPWWNLARQVNVLGEGQFALLKWALEIDLANLRAQIGFLVDEGDESIFDL